jgi:hypothetical protein
MSHFSHDVPYVQSIPSLQKDLNLPPPPTNTYKGLIILYYGLFSSWKLGSFYPEKHRLRANVRICAYMSLFQWSISTRKLFLSMIVIPNITPGCWKTWLSGTSFLSTTFSCTVVARSQRYTVRPTFTTARLIYNFVN